MNERGSALLQVLITALVAALICASILRTRMQPALTAANALQRVSDDGAEQGAINSVQQVWMAGGSCASDAAAGVKCTPSGAPPCGCSCTVNGLATITSQAQGAVGAGCALSIATP